MKRIFLLVIIVLHVSYIYAQSTPIGSCDKWNIVPYLYNDSISNQSEVCFWQNYWYERDTTTNLCFPDTLIVCLHLMPSAELWQVDTIEMKSCRVISNLYFKLGENADSYNPTALRSGCCHPDVLQPSTWRLLQRPSARAARTSSAQTIPNAGTAAKRPRNSCESYRRSPAFPADTSGYNRAAFLYALRRS